MPIAPKRRPWYLAVTAGLLYGVTIRLAFSAPNHALNRSSNFLPDTLWVMTAGFLILVPLAMGWITTALSPADGETHWASWIFAPWLTMLLADAILVIAGIEGLICLIFALPITLVFSSIGGVAAGHVQRSRFRRKGTAALCLAALPLLLSAVEMQSHAPLEIRTVQTSILIHAPIPTVWSNIERVRAIQPSELDPT